MVPLIAARHKSTIYRLVFEVNDFKFSADLNFRPILKSCTEEGEGLNFRNYEFDDMGVIEYVFQTADVHLESKS